MIRSRLAIAGVSLALFLGACGGDSKSSNSESASADAGSESDSSAKVASDEVCAAINEISAQQADATGFDKEYITSLLGVLSDLKDAVPSDVKADVEVAEEYISQLDELLKKYDYDMAAVSVDAEATAKLTELGESEAMQAAGEAIDKWTEDTCGATLGGE